MYFNYLFFKKKLIPFFDKVIVWIFLEILQFVACIKVLTFNARNSYNQSFVFNTLSGGVVYFVEYVNILGINFILNSSLSMKCLLNMYKYLIPEIFNIYIIK